MKKTKVKYINDYKTYPFDIPNIYLEFNIHEKDVEVKSNMQIHCLDKTKHSMIKLWKMIVKDELSVRAAENFVKEKEKLKSLTQKPKLKQKNKSIRQLEDELIRIFGTKVRLNHKGKKGGSIQLEYFSNDDLDRILELIRSIE